MHVCGVELTRDLSLQIWDLASGELKLSLTGHISTVRGLAVSDRHPYLFSCAEDKVSMMILHGFTLAERLARRWSNAGIWKRTRSSGTTTVICPAFMHSREFCQHPELPVLTPSCSDCIRLSTSSSPLVVTLPLACGT